MRDPERIDRIVELLRQAWHKAPDQRLGQLVANLLTDAKCSDVWVPDDDVAERKLRWFLVAGFAGSQGDDMSNQDPTLEAHVVEIETHGTNHRWACSCRCDPGDWTTARSARNGGARHVAAMERGR